MICSYPVQTYYEYVQPNRDQFGLIAQSAHGNRDGGDSANRIGLFYGGLYFIFKDNKLELSKIEKDFNKDLQKITVGAGKFVRHPDPKMWYSNPGNFSRDQTTALIATLSLFDSPEHRAIIKANFDNIRKNGWFYPNHLKNWTNEEKKLPFDYNDIIGPDDFSLYVRGLHNQKLKWTLWLTDSQTFVQALINIVASYVDKDSTSNDLNLTMRLLVAKEVWPTWWTRSATYLYSHYRGYAPNPKETTPATSGVQSAWNNYFAPDYDGPAIHKVFQCVIDKEFLGK